MIIALCPEAPHGVLYLASTGRVPNFFATNEVALEDIKRRAVEHA